MVSIGTHVYGGSPSLASVIGLLGSPYENYVAAFSVDPKRSRTQPDGIKYVHISVTGSVPQVSNTEYTRQGNQYGSNTEYTRQETQYGNGNTESSTNEIGGWSQHGSNLNNDLSRDDVDVDFFQILKVGIRLSDPILSNILQVHQPMVLGSVGSPVGALAGAILSAAGKLATQSSSFAHEFRQGLDYDGIMERAILGEAAFCAVMSMKRRRLEELGVFSEMAKVVKLIAPATKKIAPFIMHTLTEPALRIALHALHNDADSHGAKSTIVNGSKSSFAQQTWPFSGTLDPDSENFFKRLWASCGNSGGSESSYDGVGKTVLVGFYNAGPILTTAAYEGLQTLATRLPDDASEGESIPGHHPFIVGLSERAMLGEAALQALMKVPKQRLDEGAFDIMARSVARIGQIVLQPAHGLIEDIESVVKGVVKDRSTRSASRRNKGFSYANLEREVLAYYRGQEEKQQPAVESYGRF
ncbi:hypothetical protein MMC07_001048 [Pseudocyphellaria aurata]|nr:hypothetical protein [Pseudocyphellaria aurata]